MSNNQQSMMLNLDKGEMLPLFGIIPWKHHVLIASKCQSIEEAFYYLQRIIDEGLSILFLCCRTII